MSGISVIVPVYKVESFLHRCVDSILAQTFSDFELILVDDGSPDRCGAICDQYARKDPRIQVIHQKNGGLSAARNAGIDWVFANSSSQWLAFVDSDDWVHPEYLRLLYETAEQTGTKLSACGFLRTPGDPLPEQVQHTIRNVSADDYYCGVFHEGLTAVAWNKLYHRSLFQNLRYPMGKLHEDEFTTYQAVYQAGGIGVTQAVLYAYYQNPNGIMGAKWNPKRMHVLEAFRQQIAFARAEENSRLLEKAVLQYLYSTYEQLGQAPKEYQSTLRGHLREVLKLGREIGCFPRKDENLWAYEAAYPCKIIWWLISKIQQQKK